MKRTGEYKLKRRSTKQVLLELQLMVAEHERRLKVVEDLLAATQIRLLELTPKEDRNET